MDFIIFSNFNFWTLPSVRTSNKVTEFSHSRPCKDDSGNNRAGILTRLHSVLLFPFPVKTQNCKCVKCIAMLFYF